MMMNTMRGLLAAAVMAAPMASAAAAAGAQAPAYTPQQRQYMAQIAQMVKAQPAPPRVLAKRWGFGLDHIPGASSNPAGGTLIAAPNAVAVRWWPTEKLGLDLLAAMDASSLQTSTGGVASGSGVPGTSASGMGFGLGVKYGLSRPSRDLHTQAVVRVSSASSTQKDSTGVLTLNTSTLGAFIGVGFEAFVPGWDWLSLEGSAGLSVLSQQVKPDLGGLPGSTPTQSTSGLSLGGAGFTPLNVSIHVYF
jgi:hypothetical protein